MTDGRALGEAIREALGRAHISQSELARRVGVTPQTVHGWIKGVHPPTAINLLQIMRAVGRELDTDVHLRMITSGAGGLSFVEGLDAVPEFEFTEVIEVLGSEEEPGRFRGPVKLEITDTANAPRISPGDAVIIDPGMEPQPGDMVIIAHEGTTPLLRKLTASGAVALNPDWSTDPIKIAGSTRVLGVMTEHRIPSRR